MKMHSNLSRLPEALIASKLAPGQSGQAYATGHRRESRGPSILFEIGPAVGCAAFSLEEALI